MLIPCMLAVHTSMGVKRLTGHGLRACPSCVRSLDGSATGGPDQISRQERQRAKGVVYSVVYGQGAAGLAQQLGVPQPDAQQLINSFLATFPQVV
jgi:DNA polymerase family A